MEHVDLVKDLGLWRWLVFFLIISFVPVINNLIREYIRSKKEAKLEKIIMGLKEIPILLKEIKTIVDKRYQENISFAMVESILQCMMDNSYRILIELCHDTIENNDLQASEKSVKTDIRTAIETLWSQNDRLLSKFKYNGQVLNRVISEAWKEDIENIIFTALFETPITKRNTQRLYDNIKTVFENIRFNTLSILQKSKYTNHGRSFL